MNLLNPFWARKRIAQLDAERDAHEISHLAFEVRYGTPLFTHSIFSVAFARQAAVPSIARVLYRNGKGGIITNTKKRNNDTLLFFGEFYKHGDTGEGRKAIELLNFIHSHFNITNEENLYTLATIVCEPRRMGMFLANRDLFTAKEFRALYVFWKKLCTLMNIQHMPESEEDMYVWYGEFEKQHYAYSDDGRKVVEALANEFAERWYPKLMRYHGTQYYYSLFDDHLLQTLQIKKPHFVYRYGVKCYMWFQLNVLFQLLPDASDRHVLDYYTGDYPDYDISKVGPFTAKVAK
ncbi:MAG TPA: oxygenase MpaB family protein [Chitinophagales bacterium]|nr:oxygenase MpaB family protein [Chitinophagales bacterium]